MYHFDVWTPCTDLGIWGVIVKFTFIQQFRLIPVQHTHTQCCYTVEYCPSTKICMLVKSCVLFCPLQSLYFNICCKVEATDYRMSILNCLRLVLMKSWELKEFCFWIVQNIFYVIIFLFLTKCVPRLLPHYSVNPFTHSYTLCFIK